MPKILGLHPLLPPLLLKPLFDAHKHPVLHYFGILYLQHNEERLSFSQFLQELHPCFYHTFSENFGQLILIISIKGTIVVNITTISAMFIIFWPPNGHKFGRISSQNDIYTDSEYAIDVTYVLFFKSEITINWFYVKCMV